MRTTYSRSVRAFTFLLVSSLTIVGMMSSEAFSQDAECSYPSPAHNVVDLAFTNTTDGWMLAYRDQREYLFRTKDGGKSWKKTAIPAKLYQAFFLNKNEGWGLSAQLAGADKTEFSLTRTTDGGKTWRRAYKIPKDARLISDLLARSPKELWFIGDSTLPPRSLAFFSADGGGHVVRLSDLPEDSSGFDSMADDKSEGVLVFGKDGVMRCTVTKGEPACQAARIGDGSANVLVRAGFVMPDGSAWAAGQDRILQSHDYGKTWLLQPVQEERELIDISFSDEKSGCAIGLSWTLLCTEDGGGTWKVNQSPAKPPTIKQNSYVHDNFRKVVFLPSKELWILSYAGFLYLRSSSGQWRAVDPFSSAVTSGSR